MMNGQIADGGQVMTDLNAIASNVNANAAKSGVNSDITQLTSLTSITSSVNLSNATFNGAQIIGSTIDSTTTGVTQPVGTNTNQLATMAALAQAALTTALPDQSGHAGLFVSTNGTIASWQPATPDYLLISQGVV